VHFGETEIVGEFVLAPAQCDSNLDMSDVQEKLRCDLRRSTQRLRGA
jgi:hypothetical protein